MRKLRVLALMDKDFLPPDDLEGLPDREVLRLRTEYDVVTALEHLGHGVLSLGVADDLAPIRKTLADYKPHIVFNLLEEFGGKGGYVPYVLAYLELMNVAFTGCDPASLIITERKATVKKILRYHRILTPSFAAFRKGHPVRRPAGLTFPLIVKSAIEHGSAAIAQASVVTNDPKLVERVEHVHAVLDSDAIAEEYIEGRELYVGLMGNHRIATFPVWEMVFEKLAERTLPIATEKMKWDPDYRERYGITSRRAVDLPNGAAERIARTCKRVYRILGLTGYARMDLRLTPDGRVYLLEPNPNPDLAQDDDFAESAHSVGLEYDSLIQKIIRLGLRHFRER
jgi:D-alanine-D-alanine ligase